VYNASEACTAIFLLAFQQTKTAKLNLGAATCYLRIDNVVVDDVSVRSLVVPGHDQSVKLTTAAAIPNMATKRRPSIATIIAYII